MPSRILIAILVAGALEAAVTIVPPPAPGPVENLAAEELRSYLSRVFPDETFRIGTAAPAKDRVISMAVKKGKPESFSLAVTGNRATLTAADGRGLLYGVYSLLGKLGCGFYLSYEAVPPPRKGALTFDGWAMEDEPLVSDRLVFNWHNFLSSASSWEFEDWQRYIDNSARMRFNGLMVHAYGNNPMFEFEFGGLRKPVGFLATTRSGRDWGTQHVNDVRRLIGGEIFDDPVFGASVAKVEPDRRAAAATALMQRVFAHAVSRGMGITFALDVDTPSANPQELIRTLPSQSRFRVGQLEFPNPGTPEGYAYYRAQVEQLFRTYPQITRLAVWFRAEGTALHRMRPDEIPAPWRQEFQATSGDAKMFTLGKMMAAYRRALNETGHGKVELAAGSWRLDHLPAAESYFPKDVTLMPLDWTTVFDTAASQRLLRQVRKDRKLLPIVWAHHDDRTYVGRSYTPFVNFSTLLRNSRSEGFGIIHWTTRPLDLYFKATIAQVWKATEDQALEEACEEMAARTFGEQARRVGGEYLFSWVTEAPMFGRETSDRFMDIPLREPEAQRRLSKARAAILAAVDTGGMTPDQRERLDYYRKYEQFVDLFFDSHRALELAAEARKKGDEDGAIAEIRRARPEQTIRAYVDAARCGGMTPGERALVVSLNLRWLPYVISMRQALGLEPVRYRIDKVEREPLAQGAGTNTFFADGERRLWKVMEPPAARRETMLRAIMGDRLRSGGYSVNGGVAREARDGAVPLPSPPDGNEITIVREP